jgi:hypothetical protein
MMASVNDSTRRRESPLESITARSFGLLLALVALVACSGNLRDVSGEPPQATLDGMARQNDGHVLIELALRNVNDKPLRLESAGLTLTLGGESFYSGRRELALTISARGREVVRLSVPADPAGLDRLRHLADREVERLPWTLEARLQLEGGGTRIARADGWLHRVPGQPDRFR